MNCTTTTKRIYYVLCSGKVIMKISACSAANAKEQMNNVLPNTSEFELVQIDI